MDTGINVEDRMRRFAKCDGSPQSISKILCEDLSDREQEVLVLGIRAGKHSAAVTVMREIRSEIGDLVAQKIDPHIKILKRPIKACNKQVADNGVFRCKIGGLCNPIECSNFELRSERVEWPKTI